MKFWKHWKYKNLTFVFFGVVLAVFLSRMDFFRSFLMHLGTLGYLGAFIAGMLFVSTFTVATGALVLLFLAEYLHPIEIGLIAGLGAVVGDFLIFKLIKNDLIGELDQIYENFDHKHYLRKLLHTRYFSWSLPVVGAFIIASPLPDELGVTLMGISKMNPKYFMLLSYLLNSIGIFLIVSASFIVKP